MQADSHWLAGGAKNSTPTHWLSPMRNTCTACQLMAVPVSTNVDKCLVDKWPLETKVLEWSGLWLRSNTFKSGMAHSMRSTWGEDGISI